jgi:hypothetical protein
MPRSKNIVLPLVPKKDSPTVPMVVENRPSMLQTMKEGVSFGMGTSLARVMFDRTFGPIQKQEPAPFQYEACYAERRVFEKCIVSLNESAFCNNEQNNLAECIKIKEKNLS